MRFSFLLLLFGWDSGWPRRLLPVAATKESTMTAAQRCEQLCEHSEQRNTTLLLERCVSDAHPITIVTDKLDWSCPCL